MNPKNERKRGQKLFCSIHFYKTNQNISSGTCDLHYFNREKGSQHLRLTILLGNLSEQFLTWLVQMFSAN